MTLKFQICTVKQRFNYTIYTLCSPFLKPYFRIFRALFVQKFSLQIHVHYRESSNQYFNPKNCHISQSLRKSILL